MHYDSHIHVDAKWRRDHQQFCCCWGPIYQKESGWLNIYRQDLPVQQWAGFGQQRLGPSSQHLDSYRSPQSTTAAWTHHEPQEPIFPTTLQPHSSASISLHVLRPCLFSQIVTKGEATENCIFLQRGDITCKSSRGKHTKRSGSWSFSFTVPCLYIQRGPLQPLVTPVPLSDSWLGSGILLTLVSQPNEITPVDMLALYS